MSKKKKAGELTTEGLAQRLFGSDAVKEAKRQVREKKKKSKKKRPTEEQDT